MIKHLTLSKTITATLLLAVVLLTGSCKKQQDTPQEQIDPKQQKEIQAYQNGYEVKTINLSEFKSKIDMKTLGTLQQAFEKPKLSKEGTMLLHTEQTYESFLLQTDSIKLLRADGHTSYIFPVKLASPKAVIFQNLTIDQSEAGTVIFVNSYKPTKKWIADWKARKAGKFEGEISISYINRTPISSKTSQLNNANGKITNADASGCSTTRFFYQVPYNCGSGTHGPYDTGCALTGDDRAGIANIAFEMTTCSGGGNGGGVNTTPTPPGNYDPCDSAPTSPIGDDRTITEIGTPIIPPITPCDEDLPELPEPAREIKLDSSVTNNPKIDCLLKKLLGLDGTAGNAQMKSLLAAFSSKGFDIYFKIGTTLDTNSKAEASVNQNDPTKYYIVLNRNKINSESQMSWVKTLLHEAFHIQLIQKAYEVFGTAAINLWYTKPEKMTLHQLMDYMEMKGIAGNHPFFPIEHHEYMAENINIIKDGLKSFSQANNPASIHNSFTDDHFSGLAFEGLNQTSYYLNYVLKDANGNLKTTDYNGTQTPLSTVYYWQNIALQTQSNIPCN